jgi:hypothetical protein
VHELVIAKNREKLVACVVDDLPFSELPSNLGLGNASKLQAEWINHEILRETVEILKSGGKPDQLRGACRTQWEIVRKLVSDINEKIPRAPSAAEIDAAAQALGRFPVAPIVQQREIPPELAGVFASAFDNPKTARSFLSLAMQVRQRCNPEGFTARQILLAHGEVLDPRQVPIEVYWDDVLIAAGLKSRRTLAALLLAPGAPVSNNMGQGSGQALAGFCRWLEEPVRKEGSCNDGAHPS